AFHELDGPRIGETPAHGTGCTLSAAITAGLAAGLSVADAVARARRYVRRALESAPALGRGRRPLNHLVTPDGRWRLVCGGAALRHREGAATQRPGMWR